MVVQLEIITRAHSVSGAQQECLEQSLEGIQSVVDDWIAEVHQEHGGPAYGGTSRCSVTGAESADERDGRNPRHACDLSGRY